MYYVSILDKELWNKSIYKRMIKTYVTLKEFAEWIVELYGSKSDDKYAVINGCLYEEYDVDGEEVNGELILSPKPDAEPIVDVNNPCDTYYFWDCSYYAIGTNNPNPVVSYEEVNTDKYKVYCDGKNLVDIIYNRDCGLTAWARDNVYPNADIVKLDHNNDINYVVNELKKLWSTP